MLFVAFYSGMLLLVTLLWTLVHLVLGVSWLVIFCFGDYCKGNMVPRIERKRG
jgi:hypothetical protein